MPPRAREITSIYSCTNLSLPCGLGSADVEDETIDLIEAWSLRSSPCRSRSSNLTAFRCFFCTTDLFEKLLRSQHLGTRYRGPSWLLASHHLTIARADSLRMSRTLSSVRTAASPPLHRKDAADRDRNRYNGSISSATRIPHPHKSRHDSPLW